MVYEKTRVSCISSGIYKLSIDSSVYRVDSSPSRYKTVRGERFFRLHSFRFLPSFTYHRPAIAGTHARLNRLSFHHESNLSN